MKRLHGNILTTASLVLVALASTAQGREDCARILSRLHESFDRFLHSPRLLDAQLHRPTAEELLSLKKPDAQPLFYAVTADDRLFISRSPVAADPSSPTFVVAPGADGKAEVVPLREAGQVAFEEAPVESGRGKWFSSGEQKTRKTFVFRQTSGADPSAEEIQSIQRELNSLDGGAAITADYRLLKTFADGGSQAQVYKCAQILEKNTRGQKFVIDSLINTESMQFGGIALSSPERFFDPEHFNVLAADFVSPGVNTLFRSTVNYFMISKNQSSARRYAVRLGIIGPSVATQAGVYELFDVENVKGIGAYTLGYAVVMVPKGDLVDRFILQKLPQLSYEACLKNSAMRFIVSPRTVRIVDGLISTVIFLEARKAIVGT